MMKGFVLVLLLLLQCACCVHSRQHRIIDRGVDYVVSSEGLIVEPSSENWSQRDLSLKSSSSCDETYGFMPCTTSALGSFFLMAVYGYLMFVSARTLTDGCELLLSVVGPGIIGGLFLPILGAFPDALLILVSGLSGSKETAQAQVLIGMGLLAGSTVFLLTVLWGACLIVGKCQISTESAAIDRQHTRGCNLFDSGITTDTETARVSLIMMLTVTPLIVVELGTFIQSSSGKRIAVLVACIAAIICLLSYCIYQAIEPWIQKRRLAYAKHKQHDISVILNLVSLRGWGRLLREDGQPDDDVLESIFKTLDDDRKDGSLTLTELRGLIVGLHFQDPQFSTTEAIIEKVMAEFDSSRDNKLSLEEFKKGMNSWLQIATSTVDHSGNEEEVVEVKDRYKVYMKALMLMLVGAILAGVFADPLVDAVDEFSDATSMPVFFISFIVMPLVSNSSEGISAIIFASRKQERFASMTYSEIYGAVTMNNTLCLAVFLAIVYFRGLDWDFSAEVSVILLVILVMGLFSSFRVTYPLWLSFLALLLYPLSLAIVYVLDYVLGWS